AARVLGALVLGVEGGREATVAAAPGVAGLCTAGLGHDPSLGGRARSDDSGSETSHFVNTSVSGPSHCARGAGSLSADLGERKVSYEETPDTGLRLDEIMSGAWSQAELVDALQ